MDAASELFAKLGVAGTSVRDIAQKLGNHTASIFHLFPTKQDIVSEVALFEVRSVLARPNRLDAIKRKALFIHVR